MAFTYKIEPNKVMKDNKNIDFQRFDMIWSLLNMTQIYRIQDRIGFLPNSDSYMISEKDC